MKYILVAVVLMVAQSAYALPEQCIQQLNREFACENLLYTRATIGIEPTEQTVCICKSDFVKYLQEPESETEKILQKMELQDITAHYQITEQQLLNLMTNEY